MVFSSTVFLFLFLPALLLLYYFPFIKKTVWRNAVLLLFSLGFYAWGEPIFVFIMLFSIFVNYVVGVQMEKSSRKKAWLIAAVLFDVLLLGVFKYASFLSKNFALLAGDESWIVEIALPVGISFFTFQLMSYVFDIYYGDCAAQRNPFYVALYISLFPQLIAGPIVRYKQIELEIQGRSENFQDFMEGTERFIYGLGKKVLLSNYTGFIADTVFAATTRSTASAWLGAIAYTLQIYFDFSGYSDMAIGLGKMFGFHFPENFRYPYAAANVTEFWKRWHISLSSWFRDYVYIPLGGNRVSRPRWVYNMLLVWSLTGIWHGANWTFLCWGLLYFTVLVVERLTGLDKKTGILSRLYMLLVVVLAWVIFRADNLSAGLQYIGNMLGCRNTPLADAAFTDLARNGCTVIFLSLLLSFPLYPKLIKTVSEKSKQAASVMRALLCLAIFSLTIVQVVASTYNPFIYFNF